MSLTHVNSNFFSEKNEFNLKYAPHFGMFKNIAGDDLFDQLNYIADQGFTAFEDNNLKKRTIETQNKMAKVKVMLIVQFHQVRLRLQKELMLNG